MKKFLCLALVVLASFLTGCLSDPDVLNNSTIVLPDKIIGEGEVPLDILPEAVREAIERSMPIYSGIKPPDISGEYLVTPLTLVGSSLSYDDIGKKYADQYIAFFKGAQGKYTYREKQGGGKTSSDDVIVQVVGTGNEFTAYFTAETVSEYATSKESAIISGTLTSSGITDYYFAFVMLEKNDPSNKLVAVNTYRIFKDSDGSSPRYSWFTDTE